MPQDAFTLMHTAEKLNDFLCGAKIEKINQPAKDAVVFSMHKNYDNFKLLLNANADFARICVTKDERPAPTQAPSFCMLLRKHLLRATIDKVKAVPFERIIVIDLVCRDDLGTVSYKRLYCEIMGKYSNITLVENGKILGAMKTTGLNEDLERPIYPGANYILPKAQDKCEITDIENSLKTFSSFDGSEDLSKFIFTSFKGISYPTASDIVYKYFDDKRGFASNVKTLNIKDFIGYFKDYYVSPKIDPTIVKTGNKSDFYIVDPILESDDKKHFQSINQAVDKYYTDKEKSFDFNLKTSRLNDAVRSYEKKLRKNLQIAMDKVLSCADIDDNKLYGELIIAYMYKIKPGQSVAKVEDYTKEDYPLITIPLDKDLSPKENAERYFKRYNKQKKTLAAVKPQIESINQRLKYVETLYAEISSAETDDDFADIEEELSENDILKRKTVKKKGTKRLSKPRYYEFGGFEIFVGRNNVQNDRLTVSADRNDIWLHTKDYHSSHVIIKSDGRPVPDEVILFAAEICAYFSQAKTATKVPVDYTLKKHVKKPPSAPVGTVYYTDQKTIIVDPDEHLN